MRAEQAEQSDRAGADGAPARGRGRPRSAEAEQAILEATLRMVASVGVAGTTIEGVAAEAGVGKTTIYRRWESKTELIIAAVSQMAPRGELPDTGSFQGDLETFTAAQRERLVRAGLHLIAPRVLAEAMDDPVLHRGCIENVITPIRAAIRGLVERAIHRGELRGDFDVEALVDVLHAVPIYRILMSRGDPRALAGLPEPYVSLMLEGISSSSEARASARPRSSGSSRARRGRSA